MGSDYFCGIDVGAYSTKVVILDAEKKIVVARAVKNKLDVINTPKIVFQEACDQSGTLPGNIVKTVSTGYGRSNVEQADETVTEITCHGLGAYYFYPRAITVVDIGGQDNKIIMVDRDGKQVSFKMNRKCAAGTGAFLDEIANRLEIPVTRLNELAAKATKDLAFGSFCTVFTSTEILSRVNAGESIENIVKGIFIALAKHVISMGNIDGEVVMTGGVVAYNPEFAKIFEQLLDRKVLVHQYAHYAGALGAALRAATVFPGKNNWKN